MKCNSLFGLNAFNLPSLIDSAKRQPGLFLRMLHPYLGFLLPEQVGQLLDSPTPEQERQRVEVPDVELVVQRTTEAYADEVRSKQYQHNL